MRATTRARDREESNNNQKQLRKPVFRGVSHEPDQSGAAANNNMLQESM